MAVVHPDYGYPVYYWPTYYWPTVGANVYPIRQQILTAIHNALEASAGIAYVTDKKEQWWDWAGNRYPGVCVVCGAENDERFSFPGPSFTDMNSHMKVNVIGYVFDKTNTLGAKRSALISEIETAVANDSTVTGLVRDIVLTKVQTDKGELENFSVVNCEFDLDYLYSKVSGG